MVLIYKIRDGEMSLVQYLGLCCIFTAANANRRPYAKPVAVYFFKSIPANDRGFL